jgi:hypothetical protein
MTMDLVGDEMAMSRVAAAFSPLTGTNIRSAYQPISADRTGKYRHSSRRPCCFGMRVVVKGREKPLSMLLLALIPETDLLQAG